MDANAMFSLMDILVAGCGLYAIYLYIDMIRTGTVKESMLLPRGLNMKKCKDSGEFIRQLAPRQLILGIFAVVCGGVGLLQDYTRTVGPAVYMTVLVLFFAYAVWYTVSVKKLIRKFW